MKGSNYQNRLYSILTSVAEDYICLIDVDLETEQETQFYINRGNNELPNWSIGDDYTDCILSFADSVVSDGDRERFIKETSIEHLQKYFADHKEYLIEYDAIVSGRIRRFQGRFVLTGSDDLDWNDRHLHIGIRDITESRLNEERSRQQADIARLHKIMGSGVTGIKQILIYGERSVYADTANKMASGYLFSFAACQQELRSSLADRFKIITAILIDADLEEGKVAELFNIIRSEYGMLTVPIVVLRTAITPDEEESYIKLGSSGVIRKPFKPAVIQSRIAAVTKIQEAASILAAVEYDSVTGVRTQNAFYYQAEMLMKHNPDKNYSVIVADIVGFRQIVSLYGEKQADKIISILASFLKKMEGRGVLSGRYETDAFMCIMETVPGLIEQIDTRDYSIAIESLMPVRGVTIKYGVYENVDKSLPFNEIGNRAIMALETVKPKFGQFVGVYSEELQEKIDREHIIEMGMQDAFYRNQFKVYYQPKHDLVTGEIIGAEALIRWEHPEYGMLAPSEFVPIFERNGFISYADFYAWRRSCRNLRKWMDEGVPVVPISVNSSSIDFQWTDYLGKISEAAERYGIDPSMLHIEVTESSVSPRMDQMIKDLEACRKKGFKIELDDYGSGYSVVSMLATMPLDIVKIDKSLVDEIEDERKAKVLAASITLAKSLGYQVIAEGIETQYQIDTLTDLGCDAVQGFYYSKPLSEKDFKAYLLKDHKKA